MHAELINLLFQIQLNTAGLCGRYCDDTETAKTLHSTHAAVRCIRAILKGVVVLPRRGPLWQALLKTAAGSTNGTKSATAALLGLSRRQLDRVLAAEPR